MKTSAVLVVLSLFFGERAEATIVFSDDFNSYSTGNLVGQGGWSQTGSSSSNPIQVSNGQVQMGNTGQDAYRSFSQAIGATPGTSFYVGLDLTVSSAKSDGDYFLHVVETGGNTSGFFDRLAAKSSGSGFVLGITPNTTSATYGISVLNLSQLYRVVLRYDFVTGSPNDAVTLYVSPASAVENENTVYTRASASVGSDPSQVGAVNFRQGGNSDAPSLTVDNLVISDSFAEAVPEPATWGLVSGAGMAALLGLSVWRERRMTLRTAQPQ